jgi:lyso-ornithine lipid O-acyltransferase
VWYNPRVTPPSRTRAALRLSWFVVGSWLVVARGLRAVLSPFPRRWRLSGPHVSRWGRLGARCLGIRATPSGPSPRAGSLVVANHQGYADIVTIGGLFPCVFAARHDMRRWPLFGALAASGATIFINRQDLRAGYRGVAKVTAALLQGATVIAFPEGTLTDGEDMLPFRTGIFQAAVEAEAPVTPAAIRYREIDGEAITCANRHIVGWFRGEPFLEHMLRLGGHRCVAAEVTFGEPLLPPHTDRRTLAAEAEERVRALLGLVRRGPSAADDAGGSVARAAAPGKPEGVGSGEE